MQTEVEGAKLAKYVNKKKTDTETQVDHKKDTKNQEMEGKEYVELPFSLSSIQEKKEGEGTEDVPLPLHSVSPLTLTKNKKKRKRRIITKNASKRAKIAQECDISENEEQLDVVTLTQSASVLYKLCPKQARIIK